MVTAVLERIGRVGDSDGTPRVTSGDTEGRPLGRSIGEGNEMQTQTGMLARAIEDDRARERAHPARLHAAEARLGQPGGPARTRSLYAAVVVGIGRLRELGAGVAPADVRCTTQDGRQGRLVARAEEGRRVFVCEVG